MSIRIITAVMGLGMLYAQAVSASEMVRYDHALFVADASMSQEQSTTKSTKPKAKHQHHHKHHGHKHHRKHHRHHHHGRPCNQPRCTGGYEESGLYAPQSSMMVAPTSLEQMEPNMEVLNRDHGSRGGRGR